MCVSSFPGFPLLCLCSPTLPQRGQQVPVKRGDVTEMAEPQHCAGRNSLLAVCRSQETIHSTPNDLCNFFGLSPALPGFLLFLLQLKEPNESLSKTGGAAPKSSYLYVTELVYLNSSPESVPEFH